MGLLSARERRVFAAIRRLLAGGSRHAQAGVLHVTHQQLAEAAGYGVTSIKQSLKLLQLQGDVDLLPKMFGGGIRLRLNNQPAVSLGYAVPQHAVLIGADEPERDTGAGIGRPIAQSGAQVRRRIEAKTEDGTRTFNLQYSGPDTEKENKEEEKEVERRSFEILLELLTGHGIAAGFADRLIRVDIIPGLRAGRIGLADVRAECARALAEAPHWRNPDRVLYSRLRARAAGLPDPLPLRKAAASPRPPVGGMDF